MSAPQPFKVVPFDRDTFTVEYLHQKAQTPQGRAELEAWREGVATKRSVIQTYCEAQIAEADEFLQRADLALNTGGTA